MFTSRFKQWLDQNDPYGLQQIAFPKAIFVATIATYAYWIFQPVAVQSFYAAFFVLAFYESPALGSYREKERLLFFITAALIFLTLSFYLIYPFKGTFFFYSIVALAIIYFSVLKYFYALKGLTMLLIVNGAVILSTEPQGSLQVAYDFVSAILIAMITSFIALKIYPNRYLFVWNKAMQRFILCLEEDIDAAMKQQKTSAATEITHLGMARNVRRLIARKYVNDAYRFAINLRNIEHSLDTIYYETKNEPFWMAIKARLELIRLSMNDYTPCTLPTLPLEPQTPLQHYIVRCLQQVFIHWNKLCYLRPR